MNLNEWVQAVLVAVNVYIWLSIFIGLCQPPRSNRRKSRRVVWEQDDKRGE